MIDCRYSRVDSSSRFSREGSTTSFFGFRDDFFAPRSCCSSKSTTTNCPLPSPATGMASMFTAVGCVFLTGGLDYPAQIGEQAFPRHLEEIEARRAGRRLQKVAGAAAELQDVQVFVDQNARGRITSEKDTIRLAE